jgi:hypothetical protein
LVHQVADTISETENRSTTLLLRAIAQLKAMEDRNRALEARAIKAEASARDAERWLSRIHAKIQNELMGNGNRPLSGRRLYTLGRLMQ